MNQLELRRKEFLSRAIIYPLCIGVFSVWSFWNANADQLSVLDIRAWLVPVSIAILSVFGMWTAGNLIFRNVDKGAILAACASLWFFGYGALRSVILEVYPQNAFPDRIAVITGVVSIGGILWRLYRWDLTFRVRRFLNLFGLALLTSCLISSVLNGFGRSEQQDGKPRHYKPWAHTPRIFLFVLDAYGGRSVLKSDYGHDLQPFIDQMDQLGFSYAEVSSKYSKTNFVLASLFQMRELAPLDKRHGTSSRDESNIGHLFREAPLWDELRESGYHLRQCVSPYEPSTLAGVPRVGQAGVLARESTSVWLQTTFWGVLARRFSFVSAYEAHRRQIKSVFDGLKSTKFPARTFLFCHILLPHPPFVFDKHGGPLNPAYPYQLTDGRELIELIGADAYRRRYVDQLQFLNANLVEILSQWKETMRPDDVVILMGDHGPAALQDWSSDRLDDAQAKERFRTSIFIRRTPGTKGLLESSRPLTVQMFAALIEKISGHSRTRLDDSVYFVPEHRPYRPLKLQPPQQ